MRLVFLDTGPLGLLANPRALPRAVLCRQWAKDLSASGVRLFVPEICDYELRRKLLHIGSALALRRLDVITTTLDYAPITTDVMRRAAELWAAARRAGRPTAAPDALDGDCILAALAMEAAGPGDKVVVATDNVGHLGRYVDAALWESITG